MRIGYLECFSGISGDMLLGALVDAVVPFASLAETAAALNVGARLEMRKVSRGGLAATKVDVITPDRPGNGAGHSHEKHADEAHSHTHPHEDHSHNHPHEAHAYEAPAQTVHEETAHSHEPHRHLSAILEIIRSAPLSESVKTHSMRAFQLLGEAEAAIHSIPIEKVHFHEVLPAHTILH